MTHEAPLRLAAATGFEGFLANELRIQQQPSLSVFRFGVIAL